MLAPWKENDDKPRQCIKEERHHFADLGLYSQSYGFSSSHVWMWELDHKEGCEHWITDALELWCWRRLLRVPWTARRSTQPILKEISPEHSLEGMILKFQYFIIIIIFYFWPLYLVHMQCAWERERDYLMHMSFVLMVMLSHNKSLRLS